MSLDATATIIAGAINDALRVIDSIRENKRPKECCGHRCDRHWLMANGNGRRKAVYICLSGFCRCGWPKALARRVKAALTPAKKVSRKTMNKALTTHFGRPV